MEKFIPSILMERVLGIGVAVIAIVSISDQFPEFFFCLTPKRCSSSMIISPRSLNLIFPEINLCSTISTRPFSMQHAFVIFRFFSNRDNPHISTGKAAKRSLNV